MRVNATGKIRDAMAARSGNLYARPALLTNAFAYNESNGGRINYRITTSGRPARDRLDDLRTLPRCSMREVCEHFARDLLSRCTEQLFLRFSFDSLLSEGFVIRSGSEGLGKKVYYLESFSLLDRWVLSVCRNSLPL